MVIMLFSCFLGFPSDPLFYSSFPLFPVLISPFLVPYYFLCSFSCVLLCADRGNADGCPPLITMLTLKPKSRFKGCTDFCFPWLQCMGNAKLSEDSCCNRYLCFFFFHDQLHYCTLDCSLVLYLKYSINTLKEKILKVKVQHAAQPKHLHGGF